MKALNEVMNKKGGVSGKRPLRARKLKRFERAIIAQLLLGSINQKHDNEGHRILLNSTRYLMPLHDDSDSVFSKTRQVRFHDKVSVLEIPSHRCYPKDVRKSIWSGKREIKINAVRNRREFAAEGKDASKVKEEDEFVVIGNELMHPATYRRHKKAMRTIRMC